MSEWRSMGTMPRNGVHLREDRDQRAAGVNLLEQFGVRL